VEFFISYSERDGEAEKLVSRALMPFGAVTGKTAVEAGGLSDVRGWAAARRGSPAVVVCLLSRGYLDLAADIARVSSRTDGAVWINIYLETMDLAPDRAGISIAGMGAARAADYLDLVLDAVLTDPDLFAPPRESASLGMTSGEPARLSLDQLIEARREAEASAGAKDWGTEGLIAYAEPAPVQVQMPSRHAPTPAAMRPHVPPAPRRKAMRAAVGGGRLLRWLLIGGAIVAVAAISKDSLFGALGVTPLLSPGIVPPMLPPAGRVDVSAFGPQGGAPGEQVLVQVLLHAQADLRAAGREARLAEPGATRRMTATLTQEIAHGQLVTVMAEGDDVSVDEPIQRIVWRGEPVAAQFLLRLPRSPGTTYLRCRLLVDNVPVGSLRFGLRVSEGAVEPKVEMRGDSARRYRRAFLSYASADRTEVIKRVQGLRAAGIEFFQDVLSLEPGEQWEQRLYDEIDRCDVFLLFWSSNAAKSEWVARETDRALARQRGSTMDVPEITPIIIEGPPVAAPIPESLRHLHFNDYLMLGAMSEPRH
jgi:hypothetical protein